jgi:hypothetical protein
LPVVTENAPLFDPAAPVTNDTSPDDPSLFDENSFTLPEETLLAPEDRSTCPDGE